MELWDLFDEYRNRLPGTMRRGEPQPPGTYHLVVHICIFDESGRMLIQHRQPFKSGWPDRWDFSVGGSAIAGDDSRTAAEREMREEIGLSLDLTQIRPALTVNFETGFDDFYLLTHPVDIAALTPQPEEVSELRWASREEIHEMIHDGRFIPYHLSLIDLLFDLKDERDLHQQEEKGESAL